MKCFVIGGWTHYFQRRTSFNSINRRAMVLVCNVNCTGWCHSHTSPQGLSISLLKSSFSLDTPLIHSLLYHLKWQSCVAYYSGHFLRNKLLHRFTIVLAPPSVFIQTKIATMSWGSILHGDNIVYMVHHWPNATRHHKSVWSMFTWLLAYCQSLQPERKWLFFPPFLCLQGLEQCLGISHIIIH